MSEIFNIKRFWTYFKFDLKQMWRNHSKASILIGGSVAIIYILAVTFSLIFAQRWAAPSLVARLVTLVTAFTILELYQTRTYGHLTDKGPGSSWLMVPASRTEKFVSMLLMTLVVIPVLFFVVFFLLDAFLCLVDPTCGPTVAGTFFSGYGSMVDALTDMNGNSPIIVTPSSVVFPMIVAFVTNFLYFLLCGICFRKNKIVWGILILFGISTVFSLVSGLVLPHLSFDWLFESNFSGEQIAKGATGLMNASVALGCVVAAGLGWGVWHRIKTIQH